ncbi:MAG: response regulator [Acidobacteriaceae bacterium]
MAEKNPRILCLDDHEHNLRIRKMLLEQFGCDVTPVTSAQECLRAATGSAFDLVLLDYHLGGKETNGEDVAKDLHACLPNVPLIMLTGDPDIPDSARTCVDALLIKGESNPGDLLRTIQFLLPGYDLRERHESIVSSIFPDAKPATQEGLRQVRRPSEREKSPVPWYRTKGS